jgi:hypothetical protein
MKKESVRAIEQSWNLWINCLEGDDVNSIFNQVRRLLSNYAFFDLLLAGRRSILEKNSEQPELYKRINNFIDYIYFDSQAARIRRLIEPNQNGQRNINQRKKLDGHLGVFSLVPLLEEIRFSRKDLTRKIYFQLRSLPYDYLDLENQKKVFQTSLGPTQLVKEIADEFDPERIERAHILFDRLCGVKERNPSDVIRDEVFEKLIQKLCSFQNLITHVNKFIAHSATPDSRQAYKNKLNVKWSDIGEACKTIYEISEFLALFFSDTEYIGLVLIPPYIFSEKDQSLLMAYDISSLSEEWIKYQEETESWRINCYESVFSYISNVL